MSQTGGTSQERGMTLFFGYRHLAYEAEEGNNVITERQIAFSGPDVGYRFSFWRKAVKRRSR